MRRSFLFYSLLVLIFSACQNPAASNNELGLTIRLSPDSSTVLINQLPAELLTKLRTTASDTLIWKQFFAVYAEPEDADLRDFQQPLPGKYTVLKEGVSFKPQTPFKKEQAYFVLVYAQNLELNFLDMLQKNGMKSRRKPLEYKFRY